MKCNYPIQSSILVFFWIVLIPAVTLTHIAISKMIPAISDLPDNIVKGFDETFKFAVLNSTSKEVRDAAAAAVEKCGLQAKVVCVPNRPALPAPDRVEDVSAERQSVVDKFTTSLEIVEKIAGDKYFGIAGLNSTRTDLSKIRDSMTMLENNMTCLQIAIAFCSVYTSSGSVSDNIGEVNNVIADFRDNKAIQEFTEFKGNLSALHALPWVFVVGMVFFTCFWLRGGVCCFCKGGTLLGILLIPYALLALATLILNFVIGAVGLAISRPTVQEEIKVSVLNGDPNLKEVIDHVKTNYGEFWSIVAQPFEEAGELMMYGAFVWVGICFVNLLFTMFVCCCRPCCIRPESKDDSGGGNSSNYPGNI